LSEYLVALAEASPVTDKINVKDDNELLVWARTFGITQEELKHLVEEVGPAPAGIRAALKRAELSRSGGRHGPA
jgi:hypothetical protein